MIFKYPQIMRINHCRSWKKKSLRCSCVKLHHVFRSLFCQTHSSSLWTSQYGQKVV